MYIMHIKCLFAKHDLQAIFEHHWSRVYQVELKRKIFMKSACHQLRSNPLLADFLHLRYPSLIHVDPECTNAHINSKSIF